MDIKAKIEEIVEKVKNDDSLMEDFKKDPIKVVEKLVGVDLPDDIIEKVVDGVKAKVSADKISDAMDSLKKLF